MSITTWKKEFYQGEIRAAARSDLAAAEHSLKKWKGLTAENLKKHEVIHPVGFKMITNPITDGKFPIDASSCALCFRYESTCSECPLHDTLGRSCDSDTRDHEGLYKVWKNYDRPQRMIEALEKTVIRLKKVK